jgi:cephalosporin-C deacetylase
LVRFFIFMPQKLNSGNFRDMKNNLFLLALILILFPVEISGQADGFMLKQTNQAGVYKRGERVTVFAYPGHTGGDSLHVRLMKNNSQTIFARDMFCPGDSLLVLDRSFKEACSIIVDVKGAKASSSTGFVIDPGRIKPGATRPHDFKEYWAGQKKALNELPFEVKSIPVEAKYVPEGIICTNIEINCTGPKPARGYYARPAGAAPKSLPAVLLVHAAGVKGSWCRSEPLNATNYAKKGAICFDLNAHGMLNGQPESYYADLENGELKNYFIRGVTSREDFYFRDMYLRLLRTIDFLARQPEWDGKRIIVIGESQGGGQALAASGLDSRVTAAVAIVPAMCDYLGALAGRRGGWPQPFENNEQKAEMKNVLPYFDDALLLKGSRASIFCEIGLIDLTCPPASVYAAVNQSRGRKIICPVPYRGHQTQPFSASQNKLWQESVYKERETFINDFLK